MIKTGVDIIEVSRIKRLIDKDDNISNNNFINRIYTDSEIKYSESKNFMRYESYSARFAAKEAIYKAISEYIDEEETLWKNIEIVNDKNGRPKVNLYFDFKNKVKIKSIDISLSHIKDYAVASCVVEIEEGV